MDMATYGFTLSKILKTDESINHHTNKADTKESLRVKLNNIFFALIDWFGHKAHPH